MQIAAIHAVTGTPGGIQLRDLSVLGSEPVILQNQMLAPEIAVAVALTLLIDPACKTSGEALCTVTETLAPVTISEAQQQTVLCYIRSLRRQFVDPEDNGAQGMCIAGKHGRSISGRMPSTVGNSKAAR